MATDGSGRPRSVKVGLTAALLTAIGWTTGSAGLILVAARGGDPVALTLGVVTLMAAVASLVLVPARRSRWGGAWLPIPILSGVAALCGLGLAVLWLAKLPHLAGMDPVAIVALGVSGVVGFCCVGSGTTAVVLLSERSSRRWFAAERSGRDWRPGHPPARRHCSNR